MCMLLKLMLIIALLVGLCNSRLLYMCALSVCRELVSGSMLIYFCSLVLHIGVESYLLSLDTALLV